MSVPQYLRQISLKIGDADRAVDLSEMRIRFAVRRGDLKTPNSADIRVYNLSDDTMEWVQREFTRVVLQAGYAGNYGTIFDGTIKQARRGRESPTDTYLDITAADGDSAYNFAVMNATLAAGSTAQDHLELALKSMESRGVSLGEAPQLSASKLARGKVFYGMTRDFLDVLGKTQDVSWSIQDGKLTLIPNTAYLPGEAVVLTSATGMIGLPEQTQNGVNAKALLNPGIRIGRRIKIDNASIQLYRYGLSVENQPSNGMVRATAYLASDGFYRPIVIDHYGDTRGNEWYTSIIAIAVDAALPPGLINRPESPGVGPVGPVKPYD